MKMTPENKERAKAIILGLLKHPMVSQSYIAAQLYGADTSSNRSRLNHRTTTKYQWQDWELRRILVVFEEFADFVDKQRDAVADIPEMREDFDQLPVPEEEAATEAEDDQPTEVHPNFAHAYETLATPATDLVEAA